MVPVLVLLVGAAFQIKREKAHAAAQEILQTMEPAYVPRRRLRLSVEDRERLQTILDKVDIVARGTENAASTVKSMKEGQ